MENTPILPNELRVGNVLMYTGSDEGPMRCKIDAMDIFFCQNRNEEFNSIHQRIPITEEILLEMGFQIHGRRISKDWFYLWSDNQKIVFALAEMQEETGAYLVINFLHQLQNLYFALTGEELTINTKEQ